MVVISLLFVLHMIGKNGRIQPVVMAPCGAMHVPLHMRTDPLTSRAPGLMALAPEGGSRL